MPFTANDFIRAADYARQAISSADPIDQITKARPFLAWLMANKAPVAFTGGVFREKLRIANDTNYQNYFGRDQVTYNSRDPVRLTTVPYFNFHDGFGFDEDEMAIAGIVLTDDKEAVASGAEKLILANKLTESHTALKEGAMTELDIELHLDGSASTKAVPGLDYLVDTTPATGTVLGFDSSTSTWWQNNAAMGVASNVLLATMEAQWRACITYGGTAPNKIFVGSAFLDAYRAALLAAGYTQVNYTGGKGGVVAMDGAVGDLYFKGVLLEWDPTFETLDARLGAITYPWTKRCYFLNSTTGPKLRPYAGRWMLNRKPERLPDRYFHYWGLTSAQGMSISKRNSNSVISVA